MVLAINISEDQAEKLGAEAKRLGRNPHNRQAGPQSLAAIGRRSVVVSKSLRYLFVR